MPLTSHGSHNHSEQVCFIETTESYFSYFVMNTKDKHMSVPLLDANPYRLISLHLDPVCLVIIWLNFKF